MIGSCASAVKGRPGPLLGSVDGDASAALEALIVGGDGGDAEAAHDRDVDGVARQRAGREYLSAHLGDVVGENRLQGKQGGQRVERVVECLHERAYRLGVRAEVLGAAA